MSSTLDFGKAPSRPPNRMRTSRGSRCSMTERNCCFCCCVQSASRSGPLRSCRFLSTDRIDRQASLQQQGPVCLINHCTWTILMPGCFSLERSCCSMTERSCCCCCCVQSASQSGLLSSPGYAALIEQSNRHLCNSRTQQDAYSVSILDILAHVPSPDM